jgi:hypothetical protein
MRNLLALVGLLVVLFLGIGYHQGWYNIARQSAPDGTQRFQVDFHSERFTKDTQHVLERGGQFISDLGSKSGEGERKSEFVGPPAPDNGKAQQKPVPGWLDLPNWGSQPPNSNRK